MPIHGKQVKFEQPPMGLNAAVICGVWDIGTQKFEWQGKVSENPQLVIGLELAEKQTEGDHVGQPFRVYKFENLYMSKNAKCRKDVQALLGRILSDSEAATFDLETLVGTNCYVTLIGDGEKFKIDSFSANLKPNPKLKIEDTKEPEFVTKKRGESLETKSGTQAPASSAPPHDDSDIPF